MNNNLIIKRQELMNRQLEVHVEVHWLNKFIETNGDLFIEEDSKKALKKMNAYLNSKKELQEALWKEREQLNKDINLTCKHEILREKHEQLLCSICDSWFWSKEIDFDHVLLIGEISNCIPEPPEVERIIFEMAKKGEDPIESFEDYSYENPKLGNVKIYKRRMTK